ncbi:MAG: thymidine kinase [Flavobacteriales bacterium]|nr:thymidine kinase [Flavobacteriales bacterium]
MFLENNIDKNNKIGWVEVVCGSMFSGKTEELIRRLKRAKIAKLKVEIFKPAIDIRYDEDDVVSHDQNALEAIPVPASSNIEILGSGFDVIGIDEAQFFDMGLVGVCERLAAQGTRVIVAGLDMDYKGNPFGPIPNLLATAEYVTKVHAICVRCGNLANHSHRISSQSELVVLGESESYEPLCRRCFASSRTLEEKSSLHKQS